MKKFLSIFLFFLVFISLFVGCSFRNNKTSDYENSSDSEDMPVQNHNNFSTLGKIDESIISAGFFSEGLCLVETMDKTGKTHVYCIDKEGNKRFQLDGKYANETMSSRFHHGLIYLFHAGAICDSKGNIIFPSDVGVSNLYHAALEEGYILADIANEYGTKVGIMNTNFEWVVEPNEELYNNFCSKSGEYCLDKFHSSSNYCHDGYYYVSKAERFISLKTGEAYNYYDRPFELPEEGYICDEYDPENKEQNGDTLIDLSEYEDDYSVYIFNFEDKHAPIIFYNESTGETSFTLIDKTGAFLFDPIITFKGLHDSICFDGNYIILTGKNYPAVQCYDVRGNLVAEKELSTQNKQYYGIHDGVVYAVCYDEGSEFGYSFLNPDFTPLF